MNETLPEQLLQGQGGGGQRLANGSMLGTWNLVSPFCTRSGMENDPSQSLLPSTMYWRGLILGLEFKILE